jgi:hypothetical protein
VGCRLGREVIEVHDFDGLARGQYDAADVMI